jgi:hypothetical protein
MSLVLLAWHQSSADSTFSNSLGLVIKQIKPPNFTQQGIFVLNEQQSPIPTRAKTLHIGCTGIAAWGQVGASKVDIEALKG